jgi:hypothetical protein
MTAKGNILKDSFYKERLARTSNHIIKGYTTTHFALPPQEDESDTDAVVISTEYIPIHAGRSSWTSNSTSPTSARPHAVLLLRSDSLYAPTSASQLYMYLLTKEETGLV